MLIVENCKIDTEINISVEIIFILKFQLNKHGMRDTIAENNMLYVIPSFKSIVFTISLVNIVLVELKSEESIENKITDDMICSFLDDI